MNIKIKQVKPDEWEVYDGHIHIANFFGSKSIKYVELLTRRDIARSDLLILIASAVKDYINSTLRYEEWLQAHGIYDNERIKPKNWLTRVK